MYMVMFIPLSIEFVLSCPARHSARDSGGFHAPFNGICDIRKQRRNNGEKDNRHTNLPAGIDGSRLAGSDYAIAATCDWPKKRAL